MSYTTWVLVIESVLIITVNVITIVIFTTTLRLRTRQYVLIISLAVADLLVGLISVPMHIVYEEEHLVSNQPWLSRLYYAQDTFFGAASLFGLAALAIERAHATFAPFKHHTLTNVPYVVGIIIMWVVPFAASAVPFAFDNEAIIGVPRIGTIAISLIIIVTAYLLIFINVRCLATQQSHNMTDHGNKKLTATIAIVTILSLMTWAPYQSAVIFHLIKKSKTKTSWLVRNTTKLIIYANSLVNFFIYAWRMREFKREIIRKMKCCRKITPEEDIEIQENNQPATSTRQSK